MRVGITLPAPTGIGRMGCRWKPKGVVALQCGSPVTRRSSATQAEMFEPLGKLFGLFAMGSLWKAHGLTHPLGDDSRGFIDVIIHDLDPDSLRDIAPTIPFEMVQQVLFIGNSEELAGQFEAYGRAGLEHVVLANITGVVGGMTEIMARAMELPMLKAALSEL